MKQVTTNGWSRLALMFTETTTYLLRGLRGFLVFLVLALTCGRLHASDWPHLLGPTRDAVYAGPALATNWPAGGPRIVWKLEVGEGYSSPVIAEGRLIQCHRLEDLLHVECLDPATGTRRWTFKHDMKFRDGAFFGQGPRPTPACS